MKPTTPIISTFLFMECLARFGYSKGNSLLESIFSLPPMYALFTANIHKSHLEGWVDLAKLDPCRVTIVDSLVKLTGPVVIITPKFFGISTLTLFWISKIGVTLLSAVVVGILVEKLRSTEEKVKKVHSFYIAGISVDLIKARSIAITALSLVASATAGALAWRQLSKIIPTTSGIFFYNLPFTRS